MVAGNLKPSHRVVEYVERILVIENDQATAPTALPLYANGVPTLLFQSVKGTIGNHQTGHITLFGQTIQPQNLNLNGNFGLIAYFFKPYSLLSLFGVGPQELTNKPIDINLLVPKKTSVLQEQLLNTESLTGMIFCLDSYIIELIANSKPECALIKYAITKISNQPTKEALVSVQNELHLTERTFQRMFEKNIGIAPNIYRRICQFNTASVQLNSRNYGSLTELAFQNGYADQSHYIRSFKEFTNSTTTAYLKYGSEA